MKEFDKIVAYISILIGASLTFYHLSRLISDILNPHSLLYLFYYPQHFLITQSLIGIFFITAGISILKKGKAFQKIYLLIGYFYFIVPFSDAIGELLTLQSDLNISCHSILLLIYLAMSVPLLIYGNLKRFHVLNNTKSKLKINLTILLISIITNALLFYFFGNFSIMC